MILVYGANGYTGRLIVEELARIGLKVCAAGRSLTAIAQMSSELGIESRVFSLDNVTEITPLLKDIKVVLNCAGPFSKTARPLVEACLASGVNYLDITGELSVFEELMAFNQRAKDAGVVVAPGCGFDVVPTDCLAAQAVAALPSATELEIAISAGAQLSPGTTKTVIESMPKGVQIRRNGKLENISFGKITKVIDFGRGPRFCSAFPLGDVCTAYYSTGVGNITTYLVTSPLQNKITKMLGAAFKSNGVQKFATRLVTKFVKGPSESHRKNARSRIWVRASNANGVCVEKRFQTPEGYHFTVLACVEILKKLSQTKPAPGYYTPSRLMGPEFLQTIPGVEEVC